MSKNPPITATEPDSEPAWKAIAASAVGLEMGLALAVGCAIGVWLDRTLGTSYLTFVFLGLGIAAAYRGLYRVARMARATLGEDEPDALAAGEVRRPEGT
jgi:F0F1-type ATP synthase assembly protein I